MSPVTLPFMLPVVFCYVLLSVVSPVTLPVMLPVVFCYVLLPVVSPAVHSCSPVAPQMSVAGNFAFPEVTPLTMRITPPTLDPPPPPLPFCGVLVPRRVTVRVGR